MISYSVLLPYIFTIYMEAGVQLCIKTQVSLECRDDLFLYVQSYYRAFMKGRPYEEYPRFNYMGD